MAYVNPGVPGGRYRTNAVNPRVVLAGIVGFVILGVAQQEGFGAGLGASVVGNAVPVTFLEHCERGTI